MNTAHRNWKCALYMAPFVLVSLFALFHHEPSRDEVQDFLAVTSANSLQEIYHYVRNYSSSGPLLYVFTTLLSFFSKDYIGLAILSWCIAFATVTLVCMCSRFQPYEKILISLGYFFLYDYCIYAGRAYGLTISLIFATLSLYPARYKHPKLIALLAAMPALATIPGFIFSLLMIGLLCWDFLLNKQPIRNLLPAMPVIAGGLFFLLPPWGTHEKSFLEPTLPTVTQAYYIVKGLFNRIFLPVTDVGMFYFPHVAVDRPHYSLLLAVLFFVLILIIAPRKRLPMAFFWITSTIFLGLLILRPGGIRHQGILMITLLAGVWLDRMYEQDKPLFAIPYLHHPSAIKLTFIAVLVLQAWSGLNAVYIDYKTPNSLGKQTAQFLLEDMASTTPERTLIATFYSGHMSPIIVFMPQAIKFYSIELERKYRYIPSSTEWFAVDPSGHRDMYNLQIVIDRLIKEVQFGKYNRIYLILPLPVDVKSKGFSLRMVYMPSTLKVITSDEIYFVYLLQLPERQSLVTNNRTVSS